MNSESFTKEFQYFFSYTRDDSEFVLKLARHLREIGVQVWMDQLDIVGGQHWDREVESALSKCNGMIAVLSPASVKSENVMDEISYALEEGKQVVPVLLGSCAIPFRLRRLQHINFTTDFDSGLAQLLRALEIEHSDGKPGEADEGAAEPTAARKEPTPVPPATEAPDAAKPNGTTAGGTASTRKRKMVVWIVGIVGIALIVGLGLVWIAINQQPPPSTQETTKQATPAKEQASPPATMPPEDVLPTDRNLANWMPGDDIVSIELVDVAVSEEDRWDWELRFEVHATYNSTHEGAYISAKVLPNIRYGHNNYGNFSISPSGTTFQKRVFIDVQGSEVWSTAVVFTLWNRVGDESEHYVEKVYPLKRLWKNATD